MKAYARSNVDILLAAAEQFQMMPIIFLQLDRKARTVTCDVTGRTVTVTCDVTGRTVTLPEDWNLT